EFPGDEESIGLLTKLLTEEQVSINLNQRRNLLNGMLQFYRKHIETMGELKSVPVLREVLG
ncbi:MAG: DNA repair protein RecO, partial [Candidatus Aenigmatarchaeota archaeon]